MGLENRSIDGDARNKAYSNALALCEETKVCQLDSAQLISFQLNSISFTSNWIRPSANSCLISHQALLPTPKTVDTLTQSMLALTQRQEERTRRLNEVHENVEAVGRLLDQMRSLKREGEELVAKMQIRRSGYD